MKSSTRCQSPVDFHTILLWLHNVYMYMYQITIFIPSSTAIPIHTLITSVDLRPLYDYAMCTHITNPNILTPPVASRKRCHFTVLVKSSTAQQNSCFSPITLPVHDFYLPPTHTHFATSVDSRKASCSDIYTCYKWEYTHPTSSFKEEEALPPNTNSTF